MADSGLDSKDLELYPWFGDAYLLGKWILIDQVSGLYGEHFRKFWTILRKFPRTMTENHERLSWSCRLPWVS